MQFFKQTTTFDFMGRRRKFIYMSIVLVFMSALATIFYGPKFGIDFMGGTEIQVAFKNPVSSGQVRSSLKSLGYPDSEVVTYGARTDEYLIRLRSISPIDEALATSSRAAFEKSFSENKVSVFEFSPGGDKLTIRMANLVSIAQLESALVSAGLQLGTGTEPIGKAAPEASAGEENDGAAGDEEGVEDEEAVESKHCESATCTWPFRDQHVYKVNLKGLTDSIMAGLRAEPYGAGAEKMRSEWVGPKVGEQLQIDGTLALVYALLFIMLYIAVRFDLRFAPGAVVALIHDITITLGIFTLVRFEVTLATIAALLTIVGYSLNDTIVVFDRIRENLTKIKESKLSKVVNISINQTLSRTILTSLTTLIVILSILILGWKTSLRDFAFALFIGVLVGTYSSIFIASPVVVWLDTRLGKKRA